MAPGLCRLGVESVVLQLDAERLRLCERLLGLSAGESRPAIRAGVFQPAAVAECGVGVPAVLWRGYRQLVGIAVHRAVPQPLLLRRLLFAVLRPRGLLAVVLLGPELLRSAVQPRALGQPRQRQLVRRPPQYLLDAAERRLCSLR